VLRLGFTLRGVAFFAFCLNLSLAFFEFCELRFAFWIFEFVCVCACANFFMGCAACNFVL